MTLTEDKIVLSARPSFVVSAWPDMDDEGRREFWASLALRYSKNLGVRSRARLLKISGSAYTALHNREMWKRAGLAQRQTENMTNESWRPEAQIEWDRAKKLEDKILLWPSGAYPERLRELPDAPSFLYCRGETSLLRSPVIAIVGSRRATKHGHDVAIHMAGRLAACGITVVSGMAKGIDQAVHEAALRQTGKSIGVLGTGIDKVYPCSNDALFTRMGEEGLLLSEFPPGTQPLAANFPVRNRIISGLALGVLVVEATSRSGSLITARLALEQNRDVFAVPGPALDTHCIGCQDLVRQGANAVFCAEDILRELTEQLRPFGISETNLPADVLSTQSAQSKNVKTAKKSDKTGTPRKIPAARTSGSSRDTEPALPDGQRSLLEHLRRHGDAHADALAVALNLKASELSTMLVSLEMTGQVKRLPGARYTAS